MFLALQYKPTTLEQISRTFLPSVPYVYLMNNNGNIITISNNEVCCFYSVAIRVPSVQAVHLRQLHMSSTDAYLVWASLLDTPKEALRQFSAMHIPFFRRHKQKYLASYYFSYVLNMICPEIFIKTQRQLLSPTDLFSACHSTFFGTAPSIQKLNDMLIRYNNCTDHE